MTDHCWRRQLQMLVRDRHLLHRDHLLRLVGCGLSWYGSGNRIPSISSVVTLKEEGGGLTKVFISPINSPLDPWIRVPRSQIASVTDISMILIQARRLHTSRHGHTGRWAIFILDIDDLMIDDIVSTLIYTSTVGTGLECLGDVFDIKNISIKDMLSPL